MPPADPAPAEPALGEQQAARIEELAKSLAADPGSGAAKISALLADVQLQPAARARLISLVPRVAKDDRERRELLSRALASGPFPGEDEAYQQLSELNKALIFSRNSTYPERTPYVVKAGDSLWLIMKRLKQERPDLKLTTEFIQKTNELASANLIKPGLALSIPHEAMRIHVSKARFLLDLYLGDVILERYPVCLGEDQKTPSGTFTIRSRISKPAWIRPGKIVPFGHPDNVLGTRWLGFEKSEQAEGLGIHGTWEPDSIGKNKSQGCVRLRNEDVEVLFDLVPEGTTVVID